MHREHNPVRIGTGTKGLEDQGNPEVEVNHHP